MTRSKFFLPECLSCFTQGFNNIFLVLKMEDRRKVFSYKLSYFSKVFFSLFNIRLCHDITSNNKVYHILRRESR